MEEHILSLSYGKDSLACLEAVKLLGYPLDRIVHAEVWATDTISADLPPMVEFKKKADKIIKERYGLTVEHICATTRERESDKHSTIFFTEPCFRESEKDKSMAFQCEKDNGVPRGLKQTLSEKLTYEKMFYHLPERKVNNQSYKDKPLGFPFQRKPWCNSRLKVNVLTEFSKSPNVRGAETNIVQYLGIAADEPERIQRHQKEGIVLPLVDIGWSEAYCRQWCEENDLLSPIYTTATRGGCWFCHNQGVDQLRLLRKDYPDLWKLLLKWDNDSPVTFHADGKTVHDFETRFTLEDLGIVPIDRTFRWKMCETCNWLDKLLDEEV